MKKFALLSMLLMMLLFAGEARADLYQDGISAYRNANYQIAEYYFREAIRINSNDSRYRYYLAITLVQQGKVNEARNEYKKVIDLAPNSEAADKAKKGMAILADNIDSTPEVKQPSAMASILSTTPKKAVIPVIQNNNAIIVSNVLINNKMKVNFILDTGATYTSISRQTANQLGIDLTNAPTIALKTANGIIKVPKITLKTIKIGGVEAKDIEITIHDLPASTNVTGLLGLSFLEKFIVTIDKKKSRIILENI